MTTPTQSGQAVLVATKFARAIHRPTNDARVPSPDSCSLLSGLGAKSELSVKSPLVDGSTF